MITFNKQYLPDWVSVVGVSFQTLNLSVVEYETKKRNGNIDAGVDKGGIEVILDLFVSPSDRLSIHDQADELKRFMRGDKWNVSPLVFLEQPDKYYNARVSNVSEISDNFTHGQLSMSFYCADPKKYDVEDSQAESRGGALALEYFGLEKTPLNVTINVTNPVTNLSLGHNESGREMTLTGSLEAGQVIEIDGVNRNIKLDGEPAKHKLAFASKWLYLEEGVNTLTCTSPDSITNDFSITYKRAD